MIFFIKTVGHNSSNWSDGTSKYFQFSDHHICVIFTGKRVIKGAVFNSSKCVSKCSKYFIIQCFHNDLVLHLSSGLFYPDLNLDSASSMKMCLLVRR